MQARHDRLSTGNLFSKSQEYASCGIATLDSIFNGGFPLGSVILINEDDYKVYSDLFVQYFLAEGVASKDHIFYASQETLSPDKVFKSLPKSTKKQEEFQENPSGELKIAWRYQENCTVQSTPSTTRNSLGHDFDFSNTLSDSDIQNISLTTWPSDSSRDFNSLFKDICDFISTKGLWHGQESKNPEKKILRVLIESIGSPFWAHQGVLLFQFLLKLRTAVHNSSSIALVTIPSDLIPPTIGHRCEEISDIVFTLTSLINNNNKQFSEYNGLLKFLKINPVNSLSIHVPEDSDWAFKVKKKKVIIEKLHLPPEAGVTDQREQDDLAKISKPPCHLDF